jgi:hypothetical protein
VPGEVDVVTSLTEDTTAADNGVECPVFWIKPAGIDVDTNYHGAGEALDGSS